KTCPKAMSNSPVVLARKKGSASFEAFVKAVLASLSARPSKIPPTASGKTKRTVPRPANQKCRRTSLGEGISVRERRGSKEEMAPNMAIPKNPYTARRLWAAVNQVNWVNTPTSGNDDAAALKPDTT